MHCFHALLNQRADDRRFSDAVFVVAFDFFSLSVMAWRSPCKVVTKAGFISWATNCATNAALAALIGASSAGRPASFAADTHPPS